MTRSTYMANIFAKALLFPVQCLVFGLIVWVLAPILLLVKGLMLIGRFCRALWLTRGDMNEAWARLVAFWRRRAVVVTLRRDGSSIEALVSRRLVARFPGCRERLLSAMSDSHPMVCAQALLAYKALCERYSDQTPTGAIPGHRDFRASSLPASLYEREEPLILRDHSGERSVSLRAFVGMMTGLDRP